MISHFYFSGHDSSVRLWNLETKTCIQEITAHRKKFDESIFDVAFHPSRPYIASAGADALAKVFVWKVDKNCKETPKNDEKQKSNRKTLKTIQKRIIKFELEEEGKKIKSEKITLFIVTFCDKLFCLQFYTLCDTYYVALYLKSKKRGWQQATARA